MKLDFETAEKNLQSEIQIFLKQALPTEIARKVRLGQPVSKLEQATWTRLLNDKGWAAPHWPVEYGGTGWSVVQRQIFDNECRKAHAPVLSGFGFNMVGQAIIKYGTEAQKQKFLPSILSAEQWWCQGYSEPQAGSDLASLKTSADKQGDNYLVNGSKIWTSAAEIADWIFCLVRTDSTVKPQRGISFLLIDLNTPGVSITPLYAFNGARLWNQVFFDNVCVPVENRLGEENQGWSVAKNLLGNERLMVSRVAENKRMFSIVKDVLIQQISSEIHGEEKETLVDKVNALEIRLDALSVNNYRLLQQSAGEDQPGAEPSMLKLKGSQLVQAMDEILFELVGYAVVPLPRALQTGKDAGENEGPIGADYAEYIASNLYHHRGYTIAGGSTEVQYNIIARQVLGL